MATSVTLPALGESVTEGTVTRWLKQPGDQVAVDEPLLEVSTDKVDTEIPSPVAGTLLEIKADEDETVEVGAELCTIGDEGESGGSDESPDQAEDSAEEPAQEEQPAAEEPAQEEQPAAEEPAQEEQPAAEEPAAEKGGAGGSGTPVTLPALGESVTEGTVTRWLKQVGDEVAVDEPLLEVSTDKVDTEIPSPVAGTLLEIKVHEDETVEVGAELAVVGSGDAARLRQGPAPRAGRGPARARGREAAGAGAQARVPSRSTPSPSPSRSSPPSSGSRRPPPTKATEPSGQPAPEQGAESASDSGPYVTPLVRKMAAEHGVDLARLDRQRRRRPDPQAGRPRCGAAQKEAAQQQPSGQQPPDSRPPGSRRRRSRGPPRPRCRRARCAARPSR